MSDLIGVIRCYTRETLDRVFPHFNYVRLIKQISDSFVLSLNNTFYHEHKVANNGNFGIKVTEGNKNAFEYDFFVFTVCIAIPAVAILCWVGCLLTWRTGQTPPPDPYIFMLNLL